MKLAHVSLCIAITASLAAPGCTSQLGYSTTQAWQHNQCNNIVDRDEHERCLSETRTSHEEYKRQVEDAKKQ